MDPATIAVIIMSLIAFGAVAWMAVNSRKHENPADPQAPAGTPDPPEKPRRGRKR